jgi:hypothetical protein
MAKAKKFTYLETWDTRYGAQERVVIRTADGKFVDSVCINTLRKSPKAPSTGR